MARVSVAELGYAAAFAAGAMRPRASLTLLQQLIRQLEIQRGRRSRSHRRNP